MIGAHTLLSNGACVNRVGTAAIALVAKNFNVPVLVCCETYKFSVRSQLDSVTRNELGDPSELMDRQEIKDKIPNWRTSKDLNVINLVYDVTPTQNIDMVITEVGLIPPTSVPVIIREYNMKKQ